MVLPAVGHPRSGYLSYTDLGAAPPLADDIAIESRCYGYSPAAIARHIVWVRARKEAR